MTTTIRRALIANITRQAARMEYERIDSMIFSEILEYTPVVGLSAYDADTTREAVWNWLDAPVAGREHRVMNAINNNLRAAA